MKRKTSGGIFGATNNKDLLVLIATCLLGAVAAADTVVLEEDFEDATVGYATSISETSDGAYDYFGRVGSGGISVGDDVEYENLQGGGYFGGQDMDANDTGDPAASGGTATITWPNLEITGLVGIYFSAWFAEDDASDAEEDWDSTDYILVEYQIDGSGWTKLLGFESSDTVNTAPLDDTDFDGVGDGAELSNTFTQYAKNIPGSGDSLDLRIIIDLNSGDEDIAIDNVMITDYEPSPTSSGVELRAFAGAEGTFVEFVARDLESDGEILLALLDDVGEVAWTGSVSAVAGPEFVARFEVPGLERGAAYDFKVRDEVGKWWSVAGVVVGDFNTELKAMSATGATIAFDAEPNQVYEIQWTADLSKPWTTVKEVTATSDHLDVEVSYPDAERPTGFFRARVK